MFTGIIVQNLIDILEENIDTGIVKDYEPLYYSTDGETLKNFTMYYTKGAFVDICAEESGLYIEDVLSRLKGYPSDTPLIEESYLDEPCYLSISLQQIEGKWAISITPEQDVEF